MMNKRMLMMMSRSNQVELAVDSLANRRCVHYSQTNWVFCTQDVT
jgi:hypothetical protein